MKGVRALLFSSFPPFFFPFLVSKSFFRDFSWIFEFFSRAISAFSVGCQQDGDTPSCSFRPYCTRFIHCHRVQRFVFNRCDIISPCALIFYGLPAFFVFFKDTLSCNLKNIVKDQRSVKPSTHPYDLCFSQRKVPPSSSPSRVERDHSGKRDARSASCKLLFIDPIDVPSMCSIASKNSGL